MSNLLITYRYYYYAEHFLDIEITPRNIKILI